MVKAPLQTSKLICHKQANLYRNHQPTTQENIYSASVFPVKIYLPRAVCHRKFRVWLSRRIIYDLETRRAPFFLSFTSPVKSSASRRPVAMRLDSWQSADSDRDQWQFLSAPCQWPGWHCCCWRCPAYGPRMSHSPVPSYQVIANFLSDVEMGRSSAFGSDADLLTY